MGDIKAPKFTGTGYSGLKEYHRQMKQIIQDNDLDADVDIEEYDVSSDVDKEVTGISSDVDTDVDGEVKKGKGIFNLRDMLKYQREITSETSVGATISNGAVAFATGFLNQSKDEIDGLIFLLSLCTLPYTITEDINTPDDDINLTGLLAKKVMDISKIRSGDEFKNSYYENAAGYVNEKAASGFKDGEEGYKKIEQAGEFISSIVFIVSFGKIFGGQASTEAPTGITQKIFNSKNVAVAGATGLSALGEESVEDINSEDMTDADYIKSYFHTIVGGVIDSGISLVGGLIEKVFPLNEENPWVSMIKRAFSKGTVDALDVPLDALIDTMFNGKSYQENFENAGGFQSMMQRFLLSASGSAVDDSLSFKDYDTAVDSKAGKIDNIDDDFNTKTDGYLDDNYGGKVDSIDDFKGKTDVKLDDSKQPKGDVSSINSDEIEKYKNDNKKQEEKKKASNITAKDVKEAIQSYGSAFSSNAKIDLLIYNDIILPIDQTYGDGCGYQMILDYIGGVVPFNEPYYAFLNTFSLDDLKSFVLNFSVYNDIKKGKYNWDNDYFNYLPCYGGKQSIIGDSTTLYTWTDPNGNTSEYTYDNLAHTMREWRRNGYQGYLSIPQMRVGPRYQELMDYTKYNLGIIDDSDAFQIINRVNSTGRIDDDDDGGCCTYDARFKIMVDYLRNHPEMQLSFKMAFGYDFVEYKNGQTILNEDKFFIDMYVYFLKKANVIIETGTDSMGDKTYGLDPNIVKNDIDILGNPAIGEEFFPYLSRFQEDHKGFDHLFNDYLTSKGLGFINYTTDVKYIYDPYSCGTVDHHKFYNMIKDLSAFLKNGGQVELDFQVWNVNNQTTYLPYAYEDRSNVLEDMFHGATGGHATFVTGVCEEGVYVSTWGKRYLIPFETFTNGLVCQFKFITIS